MPGRSIKYKYAIIGVLLAISGLAAYDHWVGIPRPVPAAPRTGRLRVLTYNIQADRSPSDDTTQVILDADADVVCLQEVGPAWHRHLRLNLRKRYPATLFRDFNNGFGGLAFFSKYSLREICYLSPSNGGWFPAWVVEADTPAGPVQVANVHLRPLIAGVGGKVVGYFTVPRVHGREVDSVIAALDVNRPVVFAGDFNGDVDDPGAVRLMQLGFTDALAFAGDRTPTWRGRLLKVPISAQPDHIQGSRQFRCGSAQVLNSGGSDHCPVLATFRIESNTPTTSQPTSTN